MWSILSLGNVGMGLSTLSYNGKIRIAAGIDNGIVDRKKLPATKLIDYFLEELELLKNLAPAVQKKKKNITNRTV